MEYFYGANVGVCGLEAKGKVMERVRGYYQVRGEGMKWRTAGKGLYAFSSRR